MNMSGLKIELFAGRSIARKLIQERRARVKHFDAELLGDPVWDILLLLYDAEESRRVCSTEEMAEDIGISAPTFARWTRVLEARGLIQVITSARLNEPSLVKLTKTAHRAVEGYLSDISQLDPERF